MTLTTLLWTVLPIAAFLTGVAVQLIKTDKMDALLFKYGLPAIPKPWLPRISLVLGVLSVTFVGVIAGHKDTMLLNFVWQGVVAGLLPVAAHELTTTRNDPPIPPASVRPPPMAPSYQVPVDPKTQTTVPDREPEPGTTPGLGPLHEPDPFPRV